jgi:FMN phosphatase YigB (HAD superfamily)
MMTQKNHKPVIVLDVGKVLVDINPNVVTEELSRRCRGKIDPSDSLDPDELFFPLYVGRQRLGEILETVNEILDISLTPEEWHELWCNIIIGEMPGMMEALAELRVEYRLVALSNTEGVHWEFILKKYPIFKLLDGWVVSYEEGVQKPDSSIYRTVMNRFCNGRLPLFYTDDIPEYVEAAQRLGWQAEIFVDAAHFKEDVKKYGANYLKNPA